MGRDRTILSTMISLIICLAEISPPFIGRTSETDERKSFRKNHGNAIVAHYDTVRKTKSMISSAERAKQEGELRRCVFWLMVDGEVNDFVELDQGIGEPLRLGRIIFGVVARVSHDSELFGAYYLNPCQPRPSH